ncbi:T9SS type A sorting domain-containing protein [Patiriisocius sp. Uisw_017]|jgi:hypothetical protein|uniref:T9SS type A sorting domain-containing protein n=1 Tax=Patiriisocius sp. Uisw_017 TaxID=3230968 RepID=UPI0039EBDE8E
MKTNFNFKRIFGLVGLFLLTSLTVIAQQGFCEPFDQYQPTSSVGGVGCPGIAEYNILNNWGTINTGINYTQNNSQNGAGDTYLYMDDGACSNGGSFIFNSSDFSGNWIEMTQEEGCFCYDFRTFLVTSGILNGSSLRIYDGTDPLSSSVNAVFQLNIPIDPSRGWVRICAPVGLSDSAGNLPGNSDGQWVISTGGAAAWDALLQNVGSIGYYVDVDGGDERFGIDNVCISQDCDSTFTEEPPTPDGSYCCDESDNLVQNGNFEYGNTGFGSDYTQNGATLPGQYDVTTSAAAFGANITDHSFCEDPTLYSTNDKFLLVNGKTTQPAGTTSEIWRKSLNLDGEKEYRFCANFKNMPQCTFDILPKIEITTNTGYSATAIIDVDPNDPCDWQTISFCFRGGEDMDFKITLKEDSLGDGNDLAIDDIAVSELIDPELAISVLHQSNPQQITGSINTIATSDDILPYDQEACDEPYFWWVITLLDTTGGTWNMDTSAPYGWGNNAGHNIFNGSGAGSATWDLTTNFPVYPFAQNTLYLIGMTTPSCCEDCVDDGLTYQIVYNNRMANISLDSNDADLAWIRSWLGTFSSTIGSRTQETGANRILETPFNGNSNLAAVKVYPNPARNMVTVSLLDQDISTIVVFTTEGKQAMNQQVDGSRSKQLDVSSLAAGMYLVQITAKDNQVFTSKLIIE